MKRYYTHTIILLYIVLCSQTTFSQENTYGEFQDNGEYSVFNDFRVPVREDINESDLLYRGWKTDAGNYTFRCRDNKKIRLTLWYLDFGDQNLLRSEFINITDEEEKCLKNYIDFTQPLYSNKPSD